MCKWQFTIKMLNVLSTAKTPFKFEQLHNKASFSKKCALFLHAFFSSSKFKHKNPFPSLNLQIVSEYLMMENEDSANNMIESEVELMLLR